MGYRASWGVVTTWQGRRVLRKGKGGRAGGSKGVSWGERKEGRPEGDFIILVCRYDRPGLWGCAEGQEGCALKKLRQITRPRVIGTSIHHDLGVILKLTF